MNICNGQDISFTSSHLFVPQMADKSDNTKCGSKVSRCPFKVSSPITKVKLKICRYGQLNRQSRITNLVVRNRTRDKESKPCRRAIRECGHPLSPDPSLTPHWPTTNERKPPTNSLARKPCEMYRRCQFQARSD